MRRRQLGALGALWLMTACRATDGAQDAMGAAATGGTQAGASGVFAGSGGSGSAASGGVGGSSTAGTGAGTGASDAGSSVSEGDAAVSLGDGGMLAPGAACALASERVRITDIDVGAAIVADEREADLHPIVIAARPSGGARLAWMGADGLAHIATLDASDQLAGEALTLAVNDFSDLFADDAGGVLLATRDAQGAGDTHCGTLTNLCGNAASLPAQYACWDMYMIRFDGQSETWATALTATSGEHPPYLSSPTDAQNVIYIWQAYAHHGRIAFDGERYAGYFGAAISVSQDCVQPDTTLPHAVNIHQGDRMQVVDSSGTLVSGHGSFDWGCSHSGYERLLWDESAQRFVALCKTDNQNRLAIAPQYATVMSIDLAAANVGDLVTAQGGGYWIAASDGLGGTADVFLLRFSLQGDAANLDAQLDVATDAARNERAPHLAAYGSDGLVVAWESSTAPNDLAPNDSERSFHMQARSRSTGDAIGDPITVPGFRGNRYHALRAFPDGSVAFAAPGASSSTIRVLRVLPCAP